VDACWSFRDLLDDDRIVGSHSGRDFPISKSYRTRGNDDFHTRLCWLSNEDMLLLVVEEFTASN